MNIFGTEHIYACKKCGSQNVSTEFTLLRKYNEPHNIDVFFSELTHQDSDWCHDCDSETSVTILSADRK